MVPTTTPQPDARISHPHALAYWTSQPASVTGMLGGLPQVSRADLQGSRNFYAKLRRRDANLNRNRNRERKEGGGEGGVGMGVKRKLDGELEGGNGVETKERKREGKEKEKEEEEGEGEGQGKKKEMIKQAADCGAGIGRVTLGFLSGIAESTDIVEPVGKFTERIREGDEFASLRKSGKIGKIYTLGLEEWEPDPEKYDLIWHQWCMNQLRDREVLAYLRRVKKGLKTHGWVVVKENVAGDGGDVYDEADSSVTRDLGSWRRLFRESGWGVEMEEVQRGFPRGLFEVRMWALRVVGGD